jgi:hypothetical protein
MIAQQNDLPKHAPLVVTSEKIRTELAVWFINVGTESIREYCYQQAEAKTRSKGDPQKGRNNF